MNSKVLNLKISVGGHNTVSVRSKAGSGCYDVTNVSGHQVCFQGFLYGDRDSDEYWNRYHNSSRNKAGMRLSDYFPICLFYGKKEGDTVELDIIFRDDKTKIIATLCQRDIEKLNFEEALYLQTMGFGGVYEITQIFDLSRMKQCCFIITAHQQYSDSIARTSCDPSTFKYKESWIECCKEESTSKPI